MTTYEYIERLIANHECFCVFKQWLTIHSPLEQGEPEMNNRQLFDAQSIQKYQSTIGSLYWAVYLANFDIATAVMNVCSLL